MYPHSVRWVRFIYPSWLICVYSLNKYWLASESFNESRAIKTVGCRGILLEKVVFELKIISILFFKITLSKKQFSWVVPSRKRKYIPNIRQIIKINILGTFSRKLGLWLRAQSPYLKPSKEPRNRFPVWRAGTTTLSLFDVPARQAT